MMMMIVMISEFYESYTSPLVRHTVCCADEGVSVIVCTSIQLK